MATPTSDTSSRFFGKLKFFARKKGWTETYFLKGGTFAECVPMLRLIAYWRAAVLGRGCMLDYAVVNQQGPARRAKVVISTPLQGGIGVKFDTSTISVKGMHCNDYGNGIEMRYETADGSHSNRVFKGVVDGFIADNQYTSTDNPADFLDVGNYAQPMDVTAVPERLDLFVPDAVPAYTTAQLAKFVNYETAIKRLLQATYNYTRAIFPQVVDGVTTPGVYNVPNWESIIYRGVTSRSVGNPF